jgi:hypothetical protein
MCRIPLWWNVPHALITALLMHLGEFLHDSPSPSPADDNKSTTYRQPSKGPLAMPELTAQT